MSEPIDTRELAELHAYVDGEMSATARLSFERRLREDPRLRSQLDTLGNIDRWLASTREDATESLLPAVLRAAASNAEDARPTPTLIERLRALARTAPRPRYLWLPALAAAALTIVLLRSPFTESQRGAERLPPDASSSFQSIAESTECAFRLEAPGARSVCLVGDFNRWEVCATRLERDAEGVWSVRMKLPRGRHEYMFVVDRQWVTDPAAGTHRDDGFGNQNAILVL